MNIDNYFEEEYLKNLFHEKLINSNAKGIDKLNSIKYSEKIDEEVKIIHRKVLSGEYRFSPYVEILKLKGRNKEPRIISIPTLRDRIVLLTIKEILHEEFTDNVNRKLPNSYIRDIKNYLSSSKGNEYFIKLDISKFYDNIDRSILHSKLEEKSLSPTIISLIDKAISTPTVPTNTKKDDYELFKIDKGVPQGLSISNILAQIYLNDVDKVINKRRFFYRRYVDDIIIINHNFISDFRFNNIKNALNKVNLSLNANKTEKNFLNNGFTFLSYKITPNRISIADSNVDLFIRRIASKFTWFKNGLHNKNRRPNWLSDDNKFKDVFIEELNETITGIISTSKNYGWLFYFSEMTDESLLFRIDKIIASFFSKIDFFDNTPPDSLKKMSRALKVIKHSGNKNYIYNYDKFDTIRRKRNFLSFRGEIDPSTNYIDEQINSIFERYRNKQIKNVEKDIGYRYH